MITNTQKHSFRRFLPIFFWLMLGATAWGAGFGSYNYISNSNIFSVRTIDIDGTTISDPQALVQLSGFKPGSFLFDIDLAEMRNKMLSAPIVASVVISRKLPDTIAIQITEREPFCFIALGELLYIADNQGVIFLEYDPELALDLPIINGIHLSEEVFKLDSSLRMATTILNRIFKHRPDLFTQIEELAVKSKEDMVLSFTGGKRLRLTHSFGKSKLKELALLEAELENGKLPPVDLIDMRYKRQAAISFL